MTDLFPLILLSALAAIGAAPIAKRACIRWKLIDTPGSAPHKRHRAITPLAGGLTLALALAATYILLQPPSEPQIRGILLSGMTMLVWGIVDDRFSLRAGLKLVGQLMAAAVLVWTGVQVQITGLAAVDLTLTFLWIIGLLNAFNFVDSMDGLLLGLSAISSAFFMLVTLDSGQPGLAALSACLLGSAVGLYYFNARPAELFLGDSGAQVLGLLLGAIGIAYLPGRANLPQGVSWFTPILVLGVPIFDTSLVVVSRLRRGAPVHRGHRDHTYHRLVRLGLDPSRAVVAMQLSSILLALLGFVLLQTTVLVANLAFAAIVLLGIIAILTLEARAPVPQPSRTEGA